MMNIPCAWDLIDNYPTIKVGLMDDLGTGTSFVHEDLIGKVIHLSGNGCPPTSNADHLLGMMGIIAGDPYNDVCSAGVNENALLFPYCGSCSKVGIEYLIGLDVGIEVIVCSMGGVVGVTNADFEDWTSNDGVTFVLAGINQGHEADDPDGYHSVPGVIHVGRAFQNGNFNQYNSNGSNLPNLNLDALVITEDIYKLDNQHETDCRLSFGGGTSIGAPLLAGVVTLIKSVDACLSPAQIEEIIVQTSGPIPSNATAATTRGGVIDAEAAVNAAINGYDLDIFASQDLAVGYIKDLTIKNIGTLVTIPSENDLVITDNGLITIEPGTTLEVFGTLKMGQDSKIIVKRGGRLILDNAYLTTSDCAEEWTGIEVEGNIWEEQQTLSDPQMTNKNGIVRITNGSILENANTVVSMFPDHIPYPQRYHYGGLIQADNSTFQNNRRAVEFMQYRAYDDKSYFHNCVFDGHDVVASHWNNRGVEYLDCKFYNHENYGIHTYNASINLTGGNEFHNFLHSQSNQAGVFQFSTYAYPHASEIGNLAFEPNLFLGGYFGLRNLGRANSDINSSVKNNIFIGQTNGARFEGLTNVNLELNDFLDNSTSSASFIGTGSYFNEHNENNFSNMYSGQFYNGNNSNTQFKRNCFHLPATSPYGEYFKDVMVDEGDIADMQGDLTVASSNLFSSIIGRKGIDVFDSPFFTYFVLRDRTIFDRQTPQSSSGSYDPEPWPNGIFYHINIDSDIELPEVCGQGNLGGTEVVTNIPCPIPIGEDELQMHIDDLIDEISIYTIQLNSAIPFTENWYIVYAQLSHLNKCLQNAILTQIKLYGFNQEYDELIKAADKGEETVDRNEFLYKPIAFGFLMYHEEYNLAESYISSWHNISEEIEDYKYAQKINIRYLRDTHEFNLTEAERQTLYTMSLKQFPLSAHIRSLYYILTGELTSFEINKNRGERANTVPRSINALLEPIIVFPNPANELLCLINLPESVLEIQLFSLEGRNVITKKLAQIRATKLDLSMLQNGIYIIKVNDKTTGKCLHSERIIKI